MVGVQTEELGARFDKPNVPSTPAPFHAGKNFSRLILQQTFFLVRLKLFRLRQSVIPKHIGEESVAIFSGVYLRSGIDLDTRANVCGGAVRWSEERLLSAFASMDEENGEYLMAMGFRCNSIGLHAR